MSLLFERESLTNGPRARKITKPPVRPEHLTKSASKNDMTSITPAAGALKVGYPNAQC